MKQMSFVHFFVYGKTRSFMEAFNLPSYGFHLVKFRGKPGGRVSEGY